MTMKDWAKIELDIILEQCEDEDGKKMQKVMNDGILNIIEMFSRQGHSGFSADYATSITERLLRFKPITPISGRDSEWGDITKMSNESMQQNKRCSEVFRKNNDNSTAYYISGKAFSDDGGESWYTNSNSFISIKFPFVVPTEPGRIILK